MAIIRRRRGRGLSPRACLRIGPSTLARTLCAAVVVSGATSCSVVVDGPAAPAQPACSPATAIALDPVEGGDVNTMFVEATVTGPDGAVAKGGVIFFLAKGEAGGRDILLAPQTDARGVSVLDLGGHVASDEEKREAVDSADTLVAEYSGRSATSDRGRLCPSSRSVAFRPDVRAYKQVETGVSSAGQVIEGLRAIESVLRSGGPYQLPDGQSPCRTLVALLDDVERYRNWFDPDALRRIAPGRPEDPRSNCVSAPLLASVQVAKVADSLARP